MVRALAFAPIEERERSASDEAEIQSQYHNNASTRISPSHMQQYCNNRHFQRSAAHLENLCSNPHTLSFMNTHITINIAVTVTAPKTAN